ncbi:hypothetical protein AALO_G00054790 [Alosa alosa]|uniref:THAP-type domain-containing protein n=1 Tax=Alosa alosa TaxID=278164 RepID=A0AAV6H5I7_9TELE|nr:uncharacterized protein LOC125293763 [Alosa alosa]KAG5282329.1 hypothetical protein AALO_G00054790 [Alosa alosa]
MVNSCVCAGCTNSSLSGHRVHYFPNEKSNRFRAWVRFVQVKRGDFTASSVTKNTVICATHFTPENYQPGDMMEFRMGYRSQNRVRLIHDAVPSVHSMDSSPPPSEFPPESGTFGIGGASASRNCVHRKRELHRILGEGAASNEGTDAPSTVEFEDTEDFSTLRPQPLVLHHGSQRNIKCLQRSSEIKSEMTEVTEPAKLAMSTTVKEEEEEYDSFIQEYFRIRTVGEQPGLKQEYETEVYTSTTLTWKDTKYSPTHIKEEDKSDLKEYGLDDM